MIKTKLHFYSIFTDRQGGEKSYEEVKVELAKIPFDSWDTVVSARDRVDHNASKFVDNLRSSLHINFEPGEHVKTVEVSLETDHLFDNQWSTAEGFRLFNKVEYIYANPKYKCGYWLEQTPEMVAILTGTAKCGYCGHQAPVGEKDFCDKCLGSPYLKEADLSMLRMEPIELPEYRTKVAKKSSKVKPLTESELAELVPKYTAAQAGLRAKEEAATRKALLRDFEKETSIAETKYKGTLWILDAGVSVENMIFYPHEKTFTFGWRSPLSEAAKDAITKKMEGFPYTYKLK